MSFKRDTSTHFLNYIFSLSETEKKTLYENIKSKSYYTDRQDEHKKLQDEIKKQKLNVSKFTDRAKIEALEDSIYKNTIFYRNAEENVFMVIENIQKIKDITPKKKAFLIQLKKGQINYNPDYYDTLLGESYESEKATYYIDDISQEIIFTIDYEVNSKKEYTFFGSISFMNDIDLKLRKEYIYFIICSFFEKYSGNKGINMSYYDYAYSSAELKKLVKSTDKLLWIKYKQIPEGMRAKVFAGKFPKSAEEKDYFADVLLTQRQIAFYRNKQSLGDFLDGISDLDNLRIKTTGGLIKEEKLRHSVSFSFDVNSKMKILDPKQKTSYREVICQKIEKQIKPKSSY